ncbi:MAG TPA: glycosyltransferase family 9 protein [Pyrinomonadaceae bacterium]|nr:glycosyltransferase family 9 protein [Pyrinomonadaceae bacterium]
MQFDPRNILIINFGQLGDVVLSLPSLRAIRERFPTARITVAVGKPAADIIELSGYADATIAVDRVGLRDGRVLISIGRIIKLVRNVRKARFDFVIDLNSLSETNLLGFLSGAPHRLYSHRPGRSLDYLANFKPRPPRENKDNHLVDQYLDVLKPLGIVNQARIPYLKTLATADSTVEALLKREKAESNTLLVGLFPGAGYVGRRWPIERFAELADFLVRNNQVRVIVFAGPEEREIIARAKPLFPAATVFFDRLTLSQLISVQARLTLFITNDTGPMHLAAAVGTSVIELLGQPTPNKFVPVGEHHRIVCGKTIADISVDQVYKVAHQLLSTNRTDKIFVRSEQL